MDLSTRAMIARVSIKGVWSAVAEDETLTAEVAKRHQIRADLGRYMKKICDPKKVGSLKAFNSARSTLYTLHRQMTLAWDDKAGRLLPAQQYFDYMGKIGDAKQKVVDTYAVFVDEIPHLKANFQSDHETSGAFREEDWPDPHELLDKLDIRVRITPLADASDFRVNLGAEEERRIKEDTEKAIMSNLAGGLADLIGSLKETILDTQDRLLKYAIDNNGKVIHTFKDTAITNVRNMVANARKLNVLNDRTINALLAEVETSLCRKDPQVLRDNCVERTKAVSDAGVIAKKLAMVEDVLCQKAEAA